MSKFHNVLAVLTLLATVGCKDQVVKDNGSREVRTPNVCPTTPYPTPPASKFSGIDEVLNSEQTRVEISWTSSELAKAYLVFLSPADQRLKLFKTISADHNSTWLEGLLPNTKYNIMVKMLDDRGLYDLNDKQLSITTKASPSYINEKSLLFNGMSRVALKGASEILKESSFTLSLWFKTSTRAHKDSRLITLHKSSYAGSALAIGVKNNSILLLAKRSNGESIKLKHEFSYDDSTWHHMSTTYNGKYLAFYIDGRRVALEDIELTKFGSHPISIGSYTGNKKGFRGLIDEVSIWSSAMSSINVNRLYNNRVANDLRMHPRQGSLSVWHRFGDDIRDTQEGLFDQIGTSNGSPLNIRSKHFVTEAP